MLIRNPRAVRRFLRRHRYTKRESGKRFKFWESKYYDCGGRSCLFMAGTFLHLHGLK